MIEEQGVVIKTDGTIARILVQKRGACEGCAATGVCETSDEGMEIDALNSVNAKVGQKVKVSITSQTYLKGTLLIYGLPLVSLITGAIIGKNIGEEFITGINSDITAALLGFAAFIAVFLFIRGWIRKAETKTEYRPVIDEIIE
jgi:sigma-E factor negative regulatory protein RseC